MSARGPLTSPPSGGPLSRDLWLEAANRISDKERDVIDFSALSKGGGGSSFATSVLNLVKQAHSKSESKKWHFEFRGKKVMVQDVLANIVNWTTKFQKTVDFLLGWANKFKQVGDFIASLDASGHAAIPWAFVKFFLEASLPQIATSSIEKYGAMLVGMEFVSREIHFYTLFEVTYLTRSSEATELLASTLVNTYSKLLGFLATAKKYYEQHSWSELKARAIMAPFDDGGVTGMMTSIETARDHIEQNARLVDKEDIDERMAGLNLAQSELKQELECWKEPLTSMAGQIRELAGAQQLAEFKEILNWISVIPYMSHHDRAREGRLDSTGSWLLNHEDFSHWKIAPALSILWLHGVAGSGKTKLSSLVVDEVFDANVLNADAIVYFYCSRDSNEPERADAVAILRSFVRQLAYKQSLSTVNKKAVEKYKQMTDQGLAPKSLTSTDSANLLAELLDEFASLTIVIDALDEVNKARDILDNITTVVKAVEPRAIPIRIFITSREMDVMTRWIRTVSGRVISIKENDRDISLFVRNEIENYAKSGELLDGQISDSLKERMMQCLIDSAQGRFRWIAVQLQNLTALADEEGISDALSHLPKDLSELYDKVYDRIIRQGVNDRETAERALKLLACSQKYLSTRHFLAAVSPDAGKPVDSRTLVSLSCNLILEDTASDNFRFAHSSVREYLETRPDYGEETIHAFAAVMCLQRLAKSQRARSGKQQTTSLNEEDELLDYATLFWPLHLQLAGEARTKPPLALLVADFLLRRRANPAFATWMKNARATMAKPDFYRTLSAGSWQEALRLSLGEPPNPCFVACAFGFPEVVTKGPPLASQNEQGLSPLHVACACGQLSCVQLLVKNGAKINARDYNDYTALYHAIPHVEVVRFLLSCEEKPDVSEDVLRYAISKSWSGNTHDTVVLFELLLGSDDRGVLITDSLISMAAMAETKDLLMWLLNKRPDIPVSKDILAAASWTSRTENVEYLLGENLDLEATDDILVATAGNYRSGEATLRVLLRQLSESDCTRLSPAVLETALSNSGTEALDVIFGFYPETPVTQRALEKAAGNRNCGLEVLDYLFRRNPGLQITTGVIAAAAANESAELAVSITKLLLEKNPAVELTDEVLRAAVMMGNGNLAVYLLDRYPDKLKPTQALFEHAATAPTWRQPALDILAARLLPDLLLDDGLLAAAASRTDKVTLDALLSHQAVASGTSPDDWTGLVTEAILSGAARNRDDDVLRSLLTQAPADLRIADSTLVAAVEVSSDHVGRAKARLETLLERPAATMPQPSEAMLLAAFGVNNDITTFLLRRYGKSISMTDALWEKAACNECLGVVALNVLLADGRRPPDVAALLGMAGRYGAVKAAIALARLCGGGGGIGDNNRVNRTEEGGDEEGREGEQEAENIWVSVARLMNAAIQGDETLMKELLGQGVPPDMKSGIDGQTPLLMAALAGHEGIVSLLLDTGEVDLNSVSKEEGLTPLIAAALRGVDPVVELLLEKGADASLRTVEGKTALEIGLEQGHEKVVSLLKGQKMLP